MTEDDQLTEKLLSTSQTEEYSPKTPAVLSSGKIYERILGPRLMVKTDDGSLIEKSTATLFGGGHPSSRSSADIVILYFSAVWCSPCKHFSPMLKNFVDIVNKETKSTLKIVFVSHDQDKESFEKYFNEKMGKSWYAVSFDNKEVKSRLSDKFHIMGIPSVVVIDGKNGNFLSSNGRAEITQSVGDIQKVKDLVQVWGEMEGTPYDEAIPQSTGNLLLNLLGFFLKSPMYLLAIYLIYKKFTDSL